MTARGLPASWKVTTLGEICDKPEYGWTTKAIAKTDGLKLLRTTDISKGPIDWPTVPFCEEEPPSPERFLLSDGDIVISRAGSVGLSALIYNCPKAVFASYLIRFRAMSELEKKYPYYFMSSPSYWEQISQESAGIALQNVNAKKLAGLTIPLPPLPEQHRIVAEIEKQFTRLNASVAALGRAQANLKRYRASVLKAACEGRLVPTEADLARSEGRDYEPAGVLLERILAERRARWESQEKRRGKYKEPSAPDTSALPELPEGWVWSSLEQLMVTLKNGYSKRPEGSVGTAILRISAVRPMSVDLEDVRWVADVNGLSGFLIDSGDLLFTRYNGNPSLVGVCGVVHHVNRDTLHPDKLIRAKLVPSGVLPHLVQIVANTGISRGFLSKRIRTTAGQSGVSGSDLKQMPIPLPPLAEQRRIVAEVERRLSVIQQAEATVEASLARAGRLRQSILKQAFSGKLVPQDPGDEPASALLERIRAERAAAQADASSRRKPRTRKQRETAP